MMAMIEYCHDDRLVIYVSLTRFIQLHNRERSGYLNTPDACLIGVANTAVSIAAIRYLPSREPDNKAQSAISNTALV